MNVRLNSQLSREELEAENDYLRGELKEIDDSTRLAAWRDHLGLSTMQTRLMVALYRARGRVLSRDYLVECVGARDDAIVKMLVYAIRRRLNPQVIGTERDFGYRLTTSGQIVMAAVEAIHGKIT